MRRQLIIGCGYLGLRVARLWRAEGGEVFALTRSPIRARDLVSEGITPVLGDVTDPRSLIGLPEVESVLYAVAYDPIAGGSRRDVQVDGFANLLAALPDCTQRLIFISTTGVYGQTGGERINEDSPAIPQTESGENYVEAERRLLRSPFGHKAIVLRLAGLYGPGRIPHQDSIVAGRPLPVAGDGLLNLIHVDDAAAIVAEAERHGIPPRMYVVSDGHPVLRRDFYAELATRLSASPPTFAPPSPGSSQSRGGTSKRIDSSRLFGDLAVTLRYPDYRAGLAHIRR